jgi:hypothetical protein
LQLLLRGVATAAPICATLWREEASRLAGRDRIRKLTEAPWASSLTREFGSIIARLLSAKTITAWNHQNMYPDDPAGGEQWWTNQHQADAARIFRKGGKDKKDRE